MGIDFFRTLLEVASNLIPPRAESAQAADPSPGLVNAYHPSYASSVAPEGRRMIAHGASRGLASYRSQAPAGAKESGGEINCSALSVAPPGLIHPSALSHG